MSLSALPTALIVPPVNLLCLSLAGLVASRWFRIGRLFVAVGLIGLLVFSLPATSETLRATLEQGLPLTPDAADPPQAIVILSGDVESAGAAKQAVGMLTLQREQAGAALYRRTHLPVLVSGGFIGRGSRSLAAMMGESLRDDFGVPVRWEEGRSEDTWQNAAFSAAMLKAQHIRSVYLVTHAWHMRRALIAFRHFGLHATAAPTWLDHYPSFDFGDFMPSTKSWLISYWALHEWIGCAYYELRG